MQISAVQKFASCTQVTACGRQVQPLFVCTPSFTVHALWSSQTALQTAGSVQLPMTSPCARCS
ncbi:MAG TPA: hypothetical protein VKH82_18110 [Candidatus Binatia bacterium]|nr:hypothetical protein [Candidatus Binatia bacterium]